LVFLKVGNLVAEKEFLMVAWMVTTSVEMLVAVMVKVKAALLVF
jgi:hypothetical protein